MTSESFAAYFERARQLPVYVVLGVQGSGTNLLRSVLVGAFRFCVVQDQSLVFNAAARLGPQPTADAVRRQFTQLLAHLQPSAMTRKTRRIVKSNSDFKGIDECFDAVDIRTAADFAKFVYAYGAYRIGTPLMAVKSDDLWEHIDRIDTVIPDRRVVLLTRDFRDNFLSITKKDFGPIEPLVAAQYVHDRFIRYEAEYERNPEPRRFHTRYEDLLSSPLRVAEDFGRRFGLELTPEGRAAVAGLRIRSSNVKKWSRLDGETLSRCESVLREELVRYGYGLARQPVAPSAGDWALAKGRDTLRRVPQKVMKMSRRLAK